MERISFDQMPWSRGVHPLERKKSCGFVTLLEFERGFADPNWCTRSHVIYVLEGQLAVEFRDRSDVVSAGQCIVIGSETPHRARNNGDNVARLFVVSDVACR